MGDTPRTDALLSSKTEPVTAVKEFMRTLERELTAMTAERDQARRERDALVKALMQYRTNYAMHDSEMMQKGFEQWVEIQATADKALLLAGIEVPK